MKTGYLPEKVQEIEREEIVNAMKECGWVMSRAARRLGITERMIGYRIRKYNIRKEEIEKEQTTGSKQQQEKTQYKERKNEEVENGSSGNSLYASGVRRQSVCRGD
ncbi:MAG: helix-turn-helix domain-containing protein [Nitrospirota bacterium]